MPTVSKIIWDCRQAKSEIALKAGGDLEDPVAASLLEAHLTDCAECRRYLSGMESALDVLQTSALEALPGERMPSLWPRVAQRLPQPQARSAYARFNLWVPTAAMATACAAMILVTIVQLERVAPFEPLVTPHLRTVFQNESPDRFLHDRQFAMGRTSDSPEPAFHSALPVKHRADTGAFRLDFSAADEHPLRGKHREW